MMVIFKQIRQIYYKLRFYHFYIYLVRLTDTGEVSKLVHRQKRPKVDTLFSSLFQTRSSDEYDSARVENIRVHFGANSPVSVNKNFRFCDHSSFEAE